VWADKEGALHVGGAPVAQALKTGDRGRVCPDGTVEIYGRRDRVILSGGENIVPEEVEAVLLNHAQIVDAAVVGQPDPLWGERAVAHLVAEGPRPPDDALVTFCQARLASFQIPKRFVWHAQLPRDAMGKLQRASLMDRGGEDTQ
jgi:acyl-CoA synthetase (AMP-forming)/AMP-acid ligase II